MKKIWLSVLLSGLMAGYAVWSLRDRENDDSMPVLEVAVPVSDESRRAVATTMPQKDEPRTWTVTRPSPANPGGENPAEGPEAAPDPDEFINRFVDSGQPEAIMEHFAALRRARAELVETQMSTESSDREWSQDLSQRFQFAESVVPGLAGLKLDDADCRQTICALSFSYQAGTSYKTVAPVMANIGAVLGTDVWVHQDALAEGSVVYVARPDTVLPDLEPSHDG